MIKIIASNLRDRFGSYLLVTAVLVITFWITLSPSLTVFSMIGEENFYRNTGLKNVYFFSVNGRDVTELCDKIYADGVDLIGTGYNYLNTTDNFASFYPVDSGFFENLRYDFKKKMTDFSAVSLEELDIKGYPAIVCRSLGNTYHLGETYNEYVLAPHAQTLDLTFTVVGVLSNDYGYFQARNMVENSDSFVYLIANGSADGVSSDGNIYFTADSIDDAKEAVKNSCGEQFEVHSYAEGHDTILDIDLENNSVPIILVFISSLLSLCIMVSNSMLSMLEFQRKYSILYTCGSSHKKCMTLHMLTDLCPVISAYIIVIIIIFMLKTSETSLMYYYDTLSLRNTMLTLIQAAIIFIISEALSAKTAKRTLSVALADER